MKKQLLLGLIALILSSCAVFTPHKMDVQQGNVFSDAEAKRLHKGMTMAQVKGIMGPPMTQHIFDRSRVSYVYTNQPGHKAMQLKRVTIIFNKQGKVSSVEKINEPDHQD